LNRFISELPLKVAPKSGTTKVQLGADHTEQLMGNTQLAVFPYENQKSQ